MNLYTKIILMMLCMWSLTGCSGEESYIDLLKNPKRLQEDVMHCQLSDSSAHCQKILFIRANLVTMLTEQQQNPEKFGQQILENEMAVVKLQEKIATTAVGSVDYTNLQKELDALQQKIKLMLAIAGLNSPQ